VPQGFLVHASGVKKKHSATNVEREFKFEQTAQDLNPFVVAGRYREARQELAGSQQVLIWSRAEVNSQDLQRAGESFSKTLATYDSLFGSRGKSKSPFWIVECPAAAGCFLQRSSLYSSLLYGAETERSAEMISRDTVAIDPGVPQGQREALAGPALAAGWLGYGQNPGFYEQQPPMSALPSFAAALAREVSSGTQVRTEIIQRALAQIPTGASRESNGDPSVLRAKSLLLFYALRARVGPEKFQKAMQHMLYARQSRGFDITDLISALEEESHQSVGPFVREWIKRPGVPEDFRGNVFAVDSSAGLSRSGGDTVKDIVLTDRGPKPIGPYSQAVKSNGFLFVSGQVAIDPRSNEFVPAIFAADRTRIGELERNSGGGRREPPARR